MMRERIKFKKDQHGERNAVVTEGNRAKAKKYITKKKKMKNWRDK